MQRRTSCTAHRGTTASTSPSSSPSSPEPAGGEIESCTKDTTCSRTPRSPSVHDRRPGPSSRTHADRCPTQREGDAVQSQCCQKKAPPRSDSPPRSGGYPEDKAGSDAGLTRVCHASAFPHASRTREGCASALLLLRRRSARMRSAGRPSATVHACVHIYMRERKRCPAVPAAERIDGLATNAAPARVARRRLRRGGSAAVPLFQSLILGAHP